MNTSLNNLPKFGIMTDIDTVDGGEGREYKERKAVKYFYMGNVHCVFTSTCEDCFVQRYADI